MNQSEELMSISLENSNPTIFCNWTYFQVINICKDSASNGKFEAIVWKERGTCFHPELTKQLKDEGFQLEYGECWYKIKWLQGSLN